LANAVDERAPEAAIGAWRHQTTSDFTLQMLPGGHFFFHGDEKPLLRLVWSRLAI
jgi:surfactin synthase thioesterase subunit